MRKITFAQLAKPIECMNPHSMLDILRLFKLPINSGIIVSFYLPLANWLYILNPQPKTFLFFIIANPCRLPTENFATPFKIILNYVVLYYF